MLIEKARRLLGMLRDPAASREMLNAAAGELLSGVASATPAETAEAMSILAAAINSIVGVRGAFAAVVCGAMVESGADPSPMIEPLLQRLRLIVPPAQRLFEACVAGISQGDEQAPEEFKANYERLSPLMPAETTAWEMLRQLFPPVVAAFSVSFDARSRGRDLLPDLAPLSHANQGAHWIFRILNVLDDEPFVAIEPATKLGIVGRMSGISENFQLNVLLMDAFPSGRGGWFSRPKRRVSESAARIARGEGPQQTDEVLTGCWNLYTWRALKPGGSLPDPKNLDERAEWIWNEGTPADIPRFDRDRVILLAPASYERTWKAHRDFVKLKANLMVEKELTPAEVDQWLTRIAATVCRGA